MRSITTKMVLGISILLITLFAAVGFVLVSEKQSELAEDIYLEARSFSELTTPNIVNAYNTYLAQNSFVFFNREIQNIFKKDNDIATIMVVSFNGDILYDSEVEIDRRYEGPVRTVDNPDLAARIKAVNPSFLIEENGRTVYLKRNAEGNYISINQNEAPIRSIDSSERIDNIVYPFDNKFAVIFGVSYENLNARVAATTQRIILFLVFGVMLGLVFAVVVSGRITGPIKKLAFAAVQLGQGNLKQRVEITAKDEVGRLGETFNKMAQDLEKSTKAMVYQERVAKELEVAAKIQKDILPKDIPNIKGLDVSAMLIPADEIGGDCYDFISLGEDKGHIMYIGDVTGHGVPSGIVVSIANALLYSFSQMPTLKEALINTNRVLKAKTSNNMFITLLMMRWLNSDEGKLQYVSAGHPEMLHYSSKQKKIISVPGGGIALGMVPDITSNINEQEIKLEQGDCIVLYSDGIPESLAENGKEMYGFQRFKRAVSEYGDLPTSDAIRNALLADVKQFSGKAKQGDDITIIVVKRV